MQSHAIEAKNIEIDCLNLCSFCNNTLKLYLNAKNPFKKSSNCSSKLLRSDSDSSMHLYKKKLFDRMSKERRSLRFRKNAKNNLRK